MQQTLIHYGPFKRSPSLDVMIKNQIQTLAEHFSPNSNQTFQVWIDRIRARRSRNNVSYRCAIRVQTENGKDLFVDKHDQNLFGALNRARRAAMNLLDHSADRFRRQKKLLAQRNRELKTNRTSDTILDDQLVVQP